MLILGIFISVAFIEQFYPQGLFITENIEESEALPPEGSLCFCEKEQKIEDGTAKCNADGSAILLCEPCSHVPDLRIGEKKFLSKRQECPPNAQCKEVVIGAGTQQKQYPYCTNNPGSIANICIKCEKEKQYEITFLKNGSPVVCKCPCTKKCSAPNSGDYTIDFAACKDPLGRMCG